MVFSCSKKRVSALHGSSPQFLLVSKMEDLFSALGKSLV